MNEMPQLDNLQAADTETSADLASVDQIDLLCDEFEKAWLAGELPQIEAFLDRCGEATRGRLLNELLLVDRELRIRQGETASRCDYLQRFPQYSTAIGNLDFPTIDERSPKRRSNLVNNVPSFAGARLAQFELLEELGSGASGTVWKAKDSRLRRTVAIKMPRNGTLTETERERFLREGQAAAQLQHPNIVTVYEVGEDRGQLFIVAKFIDGFSLKAWQKQHQPKPREAAELAAQLAEALHHAHEQGIIHRDLKPANVLMDREGRPHITDFGLAKWSADAALMTVEGNILGTPAYMSPEQARGNTTHVDRRSDVYGLGALLYEMLTGQPPFQGDVARIVHQVIHDEPLSPRKMVPNIPRDLETICLKAMAKEPNLRYASTQEMAVDLRRFLRGEPIFARRASPLEKGWRWVRRHPGRVASGSLIMVLVPAAMAIVNLREENYRLAGYRSVQIDTEPEGACVALVPVDARTGELSPHAADVIRPEGRTPLRTMLKPGEYLVEAVLPGDGRPQDFAEVYRTVVPSEMLSKKQIQLNQDRGDDKELARINIEIHKTSDVIANMIEIPIEEEFRRKHPTLPSTLYVDRGKTVPDGARQADSAPGESEMFGNYAEHYVSLDGAKRWTESRGKRLPSAVEYDGILHAAQTCQLCDGAGRAASLDDLGTGLAEWTTTKYEFVGIVSSTAVSRLRSLHVLRGYGDADAMVGLIRTADGQLVAEPASGSPMVGFRGVHSGAPRFLKP